MLIRALRRFAILKKEQSSVIPVPVQSDAVSLTVDDPWTEIRLPNNGHSAILHVGLPSAATWPQTMSSKYTLVSPPVLFNWTSGFLTEPLPKITKTSIGRSAAVYFDTVIEGYHVIVCMTCSVTRMEGRNYYSCTIRRSDIVSGFSGIQYQDTDRLVALSVSRQDTAQISFTFDVGTSPGDIAARMWETLELHGLRFTVGSWSPQEFDTYKDIPTLHEMQIRVDQAIRAGLRYEEDAVLRSMDHLETVFDPYVTTSHKIRRVQPGDEHPLWVASNIDWITGRARAYLSALEDFPRVSDNMLQNIASVFLPLASFAFETDATLDVFNKLVKSCNGVSKRSRQLHKVKLPLYEKFSDAWLSQRYVVNTSCMDGQQAWDYFNRQAQVWLGQMTPDVKCHGTATVNGAKFQCTFRMQEKAWTGLTKIFESAYREGLEPNAYVMWDFIPFSFVIDWFVPVGDSLWAYTAKSHYTPQYYTWLPFYDGYQFCYSVSYDFDTFFGPCSVYCRWYETAPPNVETSYVRLKEERQVSDNTALMRLLDGLCLFF